MPAELNVPCEWAISRPRPLSAPVNSPTIAPIRAKPNAVCRLARIQDVALGSTIDVRIWRRSAPRMRALSTSVLSTSRAPWKALKNTAKNTRTTAVAILDDMPKPNQMTNSDASTMRGIALAPLMKGAQTSARNRLRPSSTPKTTPSAEPITKPTTASCSVTPICSQIEPCDVPSVNQVTSCDQMSLGREKMNGSIQCDATSSQLPSHSTTRAT